MALKPPGKCPSTGRRFKMRLKPHPRKTMTASQLRSVSLKVLAKDSVYVRVASTGGLVLLKITNYHVETPPSKEGEDKPHPILILETEAEHVRVP